LGPGDIGIILFGWHGWNYKGWLLNTIRLALFGIYLADPKIPFRSWNSRKVKLTWASE
jgi:hypothetical protein